MNCMNVMNGGGRGWGEGSGGEWGGNKKLLGGLTWNGNGMGHLWGGVLFFFFLLSI